MARIISRRPTTDKRRQFLGLRFDEGKVEGGRAPLVAVLPNSSEGLAIWGNTAIVLVDGDEPDLTPEECTVDASYITARVPW